MDTNKVLIFLAGALIGAVAYFEYKKSKSKADDTTTGGGEIVGGPAMIDYEAICTNKLNESLMVIRPGAGFDKEKYSAEFMTNCIANKGIV